jgi:putative NADH-flavin reductase
MRIAIVGATGWLGGAVTREALQRGHEVTAVGRHPDSLAELEGVATVSADGTDPASLADAIAGHDAVVVAVTDRTGPDRDVIPAAARSVIEAAPKAGVARVAFVGGGGSLDSPGGGRYVDQPGFPEQYKAEALAQGEALALFRAAPEELDWTYLSPPPHNLEPGEKRGGYRAAAGDTPLIAQDGESRITSGDLAAAMVDALERHEFSRQRFTVGY